MAAAVPSGNGKRDEFLEGHNLAGLDAAAARPPAAPNVSRRCKMESRSCRETRARDVLTKSSARFYEMIGRILEKARRADLRICKSHRVKISVASKGLIEGL